MPADPVGSQPPETAMAAAIQQVTANAQALIRDEIELAKLEVTTKARNAARGAAIGAAAGVFVLGAALLLLQGLAWLVAKEVFPDNIYLGFFGVALVLLLLAAVAGFVAGKLVKKAKSPMPTQAIAAGREIQAVVREEQQALRSEVREVIVKPEDQRS